MRRIEINLQQQHIEQLLTLNNLPINFKEKLELSKQHQTTNIFTNEEELEKILDILPPPNLANSNELEIRETLTNILQKLS
ncbi:MAG: hypothetical protein IT416_02600 [Candidatus Pacebacteria bacterium]|nr:hypothetical protein [Candidatus Paceibacterota bacterium]